MLAQSALEYEPVINLDVTIQNTLGLHARPAMSFVQLAGTFRSEVRVRRRAGDEMVDGKSIMQMLLLAATRGTVLSIECEGHDEGAALAALVDLVNSKFGEEGL
ncbi:MAG: HPr family phosphocarrier protein [Planctomycetota bacterium]|nr:HPr family phosphocarrier protein [Planctomycetota bacterium]